MDTFIIRIILFLIFAVIYLYFLFKNFPMLAKKMNNHMRKASMEMNEGKDRMGSSKFWTYYSYVFVCFMGLMILIGVFSILLGPVNI